MAQSDQRSGPLEIRHVLLDIEGTTTPISFVADVLFPYVRRQLNSYLDSKWGSAELKADVEGSFVTVPSAIPYPSH